MRVLLKMALGLSAGLAGIHAAAAYDLRPCRDDELASAQPAPMPKLFASISEVTTNKARLAGYLIDIDDAGKPRVQCLIAVITDAILEEDAAEALEQFEYWPADSTRGKPSVYVHLASGTNGLKIPSVLPRKDDPLCHRFPDEADVGLKPIYKPKAVYPLGPQSKAVEGALSLTLTVADTGAVYLECRADGEGSEMFKMAGYYFAAQIRFAAQPGRPEFHYTLSMRYRLE